MAQLASQQVGANGNEEPGKNNHPPGGQPQQVSHQGIGGTNRSRGNPSLLQLWRTAFKDAVHSTNGGGPQPDSMSTARAARSTNFKVIGKATIDVTIFGQVWTLEVEITDTEPERRDIYLSYADSYMMLEGRFCQRRWRTSTTIGSTSCGTIRQKHRYKGPQDRWFQLRECDRHQVMSEEQYTKNAELQSKNPLLKITKQVTDTLEPEQLFALKRLILKYEDLFGTEEIPIVKQNQAHRVSDDPRSQANPNEKLTRWAILLSQFRFKIIHKKRVLNRDADALSRYAVGQNPSDAEDVMNAQVMTLEEIDMRVEQQSDKFVRPDQFLGKKRD
ncbi:hypothetical protein BV898_09634 [Hypsibius exemplaris]|uniref:Reverse transcriptase RNase H-like domain-containing protein n=1 Tax=Hypsibius exemplaris TaxID=2072580 RepID=A0A1W0WM79_HYPEX|nr:hypothetical protein BV898_09634 [Hypsibius exemplaris]